MAVSTKIQKILVAGILIVIGLALVVYGSLAFMRQYQATHESRPLSLGKVVTESASQPDETPPSDDCMLQTVAERAPHILTIPDIGVDSCVQQVGNDPSGTIAAPSNVHLAGWYVNSVAPGEKGVSLVDGHVSGRYSEAIFKNLGKLTPGSIISVQRGNGQTVKFAVVDVASYPSDQVMKVLFEQLEGVDSQLTLITCGGVFDKSSQTYADRVVVRAKLAS